MASDQRFSAFRARWVYPVAGPPIPGGIVSIRAGRIVAVGTRAVEGQAIDLGDVAIVPGFVNAHTHLEFSDLACPLGRGGVVLPDWIGQVIAHRRATAGGSSAPIAQGLRESAAAGTTALGEIATSDWATEQPPAGRDTGEPTTVVFRELIAPTIDRVGDAILTAQRFLGATLSSQRFTAGLSPHAPYTVHPRLLAALVDLATTFRVPLAMHLAESREELELLASGRGPFRDLLAAAGAWEEDPGARLQSIRTYLEQLARAPRSLVIHGNYLHAEDVRFLAERAETMSLVYCPRTHAFFEHDSYGLAQRLQSGVSMALGTDSRASNPNLDMLEEMRFVAERHPGVSPETVLRLGTLAGARALGLADQMGSLEAGKRADLVVLGPIEASARDPHELLFDAHTRVVQTWIDGSVVCDRDDVA
jgi:aminodeoxyfutalosine deaminase